MCASSRLWLVGGGLLLLTGCLGLETYPPAVPAAQHVPAPWEPGVACYYTGPLLTEVATPVLTRISLPSQEEWHQWRVASGTTVCHGKGKKRRCAPAPTPTVIDQANEGATVRATAKNTNGGQSIKVRYVSDPSGEKLFELITSPAEPTWIAMPEGERQAMRLLLDGDNWQMTNGLPGSEGTRREVLAIRPKFAPQTARAVFVLQNGLQIPVKLIAQERPGMLSVSFEAPAAKTPPPPPIDKIPPKFDKDQQYDGYVMKSEGKYPPPWMPEGVVDDGKVTLIKFPGSLEGIRMPVVNGINPNGTPAVVQSRLYVRPEHGAWLWIQGLWSALSLKDAGGGALKIVRQVPPAQGVKS